MIKVVAWFYMMYVLLIVAGLYGYVHSIIMLMHEAHGAFTGIMALRIIGLVVFPVGAVMGYIS